MVVQGVALRSGAHDGLEVLLVHRVSPRGWEIPGGKPNDGEPLGRAVEREVFEESAMTVTAVRHVATFRRTGFRPHVSPVFRCVVDGGVPRPNDEAVDARFFAVDRLPWGTFPWLREAIDLAVADGLTDEMISQLGNLDPWFTDTVTVGLRYRSCFTASD